MTIIITAFIVAAVLIIIFSVCTVTYMAAAHSYARRVNAECREYIATMPPVPVNPPPPTAEELSELEAINRRILGILITTLSLPDQTPVTHE